MGFMDIKLDDLDLAKFRSLAKYNRAILGEVGYCEMDFGIRQSEFWLANRLKKPTESQRRVILETYLMLSAYVDTSRCLGPEFRKKLTDLYNEGLELINDPEIRDLCRKSKSKSLNGKRGNLLKRLMSLKHPLDKNNHIFLEHLSGLYLPYFFLKSLEIEESKLKPYFERCVDLNFAYKSVLACCHTQVEERKDTT
jgi:hypothetical protein